MRKTILFALLVVGLTGLYLVEVSAGQKRLIEQHQQAEQHLKKVVQELNQVLQKQDERKSQLLRNEIQQLSQQHLKTMNIKKLTARKAELQKALGEHAQKINSEAFLKELREKEANAKMKQAEKLLMEILNRYPKSQTAKLVRKMLRTQ